MSTTATDVLTALACTTGGCDCQKAVKRGSGATHCPSHADRDPSLQISTKDGKVLWWCARGCDQGSVLAAMQDKGLFKGATAGGAKKTGTRSAKKGPKVAAETRYEIRDASGAVVAIHVRQDLVDGDKDVYWEGGLNGRKVESLPLYGTELLAQQPAEPVVVTEGEKAADALRGFKVLALGTVTGAGGRKAPGVDALRPLAGRRVFLWPDNDEPGREHMTLVAKTLHELGCEVFMVEWAEAPPKGDAADCPPDRYASLLGAAERWEPEPIENGALLLDDVANFIGAFVAFPSPEARDAVALWVLHTHAIASFDSTPRLAMLSPEKGSGKTRVLEVVEVLAPHARHTANLTAAALFRLVEAERPVLMLDEADTFFGPRAQAHEELRGLLNAGHRRGAVAYRCVGDKGVEVKAFPAFTPVALAGIGDLPDTILDRSVLIKMRRRAPDELVRPFRHREAVVEGSEIQARMAKWAEATEAELTAARPTMPPGITDRPADVWEPLLAIADLAAGKWPERGRNAATKLNEERQAQDPSLGVRLLADIKGIFEARAVDRVSSSDLVEALVAMEEAPWGDLRGKPIDARGVARRVKPYGVTPKRVRFGEATVRGYELADFHDAWKRYLPPPPPEEAPQAPQAPPGTQNGVADTGAVADAERHTAPEPPQEFEFETADVADVADFQKGVGGNARICQACGSPDLVENTDRGRFCADHQPATAGARWTGDAELEL